MGSDLEQTKSHQIKQKLQQILDEQYADGDRRQIDEGSTWGGSGGGVKRAASYASDAMRDPKPDESPVEYLESIIEGIEAQYLYYKDIEGDRDGYGKGTFVEIVRNAKSLLSPNSG